MNTDTSQPIRLNQINLICAIFSEIERQCGKDVALITRHTNAVINAANNIIAELRKPYVPARPNSGLGAWLASDDTGLSSEFMAHITANGPRCDNNYPHDPSDFGRCVKFLDAVPAARAQLGDLRRASKQWDALVGEWGKLEELWRQESPTGKCPQLYARMMELLHE